MRYLNLSTTSLPDVEDGQGHYLKDNTFVMFEKSTSAEFFVDVEKNMLFLQTKKSALVPNLETSDTKLLLLLLQKSTLRLT